MAATSYTWESFRLDLDTYRLERTGVPVPLEPKAFDVLALMVQRPGHVFSKQELFDAVWPGTAVTDHALTRVIAQLRRALGDEAREARYIETVPTRGYRWVPAVSSVTAGAAVALPPASARPAPVTPAPNAGPAPAAAAPTAARRHRAWRAAWLAAAVVVPAMVTWLLARDTTGLTPTATATAASGEGHGAVARLAVPVQRTTHPGLDLHPALAPTHEALAFASDRSGAFEIYVRDLAAAGVDVPLTSDGGVNVQPAWSPDGRWLAYHSSRRGGIWIVPARGGVPRQVASLGSHPAWAPDGRRLVYQSDEFTDVTPSAFGAQSGSTLWIVDVAQGTPRPLTQAGTPPGGHGVPAWSRDGRWIAFVAFDAGASGGLWVLDVATGATRQVDAGKGLYEVTFGVHDASIYAAAGEAFVVEVPFDGATGTAAGRRRVLPVAGVPGVRGLSLARDGRTLAFAGLSLDSQIWVQPIAADGAANGPARPLTADTTRRKSLAAVSPDGTRVAYMASRRGEAPHVWVTDLDGRDRVQLTVDDAADMEPSWYPDGRRVAYLSSSPNGRTAVWAVDVSTRLTAPVQLLPASSMPVPAGAVRPEGSLADLRFSPSMARVAFSVRAPPGGVRRLFVSDLARYAPRPLTDGATWTGYPAWSPDESALAVEVKRGATTQAAVIDVRTGALRQLTDARGHTWVRSWSPDGRRLAVAALRDGCWSLRWVNADGSGEGEMSPEVPPNVYLRYPEWSPRGDVVVFERGELRGNIWTIRLP